MYKFFWGNFGKEAFNECKLKAKNLQNADVYIGAVHVGDLCFDFLLRQYEESAPLWLDYDLYVGGIDQGYGYGRSDYTYEYADGGGFGKEVLELSYEDFKNMAEKIMAEYIEKYDRSYNLVQKANEPLHIW